MEKKNPEKFPEKWKKIQKIFLNIFPTVEKYKKPNSGKILVFCKIIGYFSTVLFFIFFHCRENFQENFREFFSTFRENFQENFLDVFPFFGKIFKIFFPLFVFFPLKIDEKSRKNRGKIKKNSGKNKEKIEEKSRNIQEKSRKNRGKIKKK